MSDLPERLREVASGGWAGYGVPALLREAAEEVERQLAEVKRAMAEVRIQLEHVRMLEAGNREARAEVERLREALRGLVEARRDTNPCEWDCDGRNPATGECLKRDTVRIDVAVCDECRHSDDLERFSEWEDADAIRAALAALDPPSEKSTREGLTPGGCDVD